MFKVGDVISFIHSPYGNGYAQEFGLYLVTQVLPNTDRYMFITLDHINPHHNDPTLWCKTTTDKHACMAFEETSSTLTIETNEKHKCHCPKEVWMYQGCKCGGI